MTKSELIARIADISSSNDALKSLNKDILEEAAREIIHRMALSLAEGQRIELRGFGSFDLKLRPARVGRNPRDGVSVDIPAKKLPFFKAGKDLREQLKPQAAKFNKP